MLLRLTLPPMASLIPLLAVLVCLFHVSFAAPVSCRGGSGSFPFSRDGSGEFGCLGFDAGSYTFSVDGFATCNLTLTSWNVYYVCQLPSPCPLPVCLIYFPEHHCSPRVHRHISASHHLDVHVHHSRVHHWPLSHLCGHFCSLWIHLWLQREVSLPPCCCSFSSFPTSFSSSDPSCSHSFLEAAADRPARPWSKYFRFQQVQRRFRLPLHGSPS